MGRTPTLRTYFCVGGAHEIAERMEAYGGVAPKCNINEV